MRSPFPGIDPYVERCWESARARLIGYAADALAAQLPDDLAARTEERVQMEADDRLGFVRCHATGATATAEPVILHLNLDPVTERHIQIMDMDGNRIVTAIELLSPANKVAGPGREQYLKKRKEFMASDANLVEIDLVRAGDWVRMLEPFDVPTPYRTTYRATVWRSSDPGKTDLYPIGLRQALPTIKIPLRLADPDVELELQPLLDRVYRLSRFDRIDYSKTCEPPLKEEDAAWARERIAAAATHPC